MLYLNGNSIYFSDITYKNVLKEEVYSSKTDLNESIHFKYDNVYYLALSKIDVLTKQCNVAIIDLNFTVDRPVGLQITLDSLYNFGLSFTKLMVFYNGFKIHINPQIWNLKTFLNEQYHIFDNDNKLIDNDYISSITLINNHCPTLLFEKKRYSSDTVKIVTLQTVFEISTLNLNNFKSKLQKLLNTFDNIKKFDSDTVDKMIKIINKSSFYNEDSSKYRLFNNEILTAYKIIQNVDFDIYENPEIDINQTIKRFQFMHRLIEKIRHKSKSRSAEISITPFKFKFNTNYCSFPLFGEINPIVGEIDLFDVEKLLKASHKFDKYEAKIRQMILETI